MIKFNFYLDVRRRRADGMSQVMLVFYLPGHRKKMIRTGVFVEPDVWDAERRRVTEGHANWRRLNLQLDRMAVETEEFLLAHRGEAAEDLVRGVEDVLFPERAAERAESAREAERRLREERSVVGVARRFAERKSAASTRRSYEQLVKHLERYDSAATFDDVNKAWLEGFDGDMARFAGSPNARAVYMRNLRAVFNFAIDEGVTANYPFRKYRIRTVATAKRSLGVEDLRRLLTMEVEDWQVRYRDFFALSFMLIGINPKDLLYLPVDADRSGRIVYNRSKTRKLYSVRVEPEARAIIERYRGRGFMLEFMDGRSDYLQFVRQCDHGLGMIGTRSVKGRRPEGEPLFEGLTLYWARHTWATIAAELDVPKETISAALGHDMGNATTAIYINYNLSKVDEANRRVLDYVFGLK